MAADQDQESNFEHNSMCILTSAYRQHRAFALSCAKQQQQPASRKPPWTVDRDHEGDRLLLRCAGGLVPF
uniref:Uncharacterized protein n=1 Tax=Oryza punctata TaxID=4537 RepID=A0A0E0KB45_ORYPU